MLNLLRIKLSRLEMSLREKIKTGSNERGSLFWVGVAGVVVGLVGTGVSAYGSYAQGKATQKMNQYQADVAAEQARIDARTADQNITAVQDQASQASKLQKRNLKALEGEQKGVLAASGVGGGSVTAADIGKSTFDTAKLDEIAIRYNADYKSWALKTGADFNVWDLGNQKNQYLMAGKNAAMAGGINATGSLLSGASSALTSTGTAITNYKAYNAK